MKNKDNVTYSTLEKESKDFSNRVKKPSRGKTIGLIIAFSVVGGCLLLFSLIGFLDTALLKSQHAKQEELTNVEGVAESVKVVGEEYGTILKIKLKDNETTFYMPVLSTKERRSG